MPVDRTPTYTLHEIITDTRRGEDVLLAFETYPTRGDAMRAARKELKGRRWAVTEQKIVAVDQVTAGREALAAEKT
jgi:hypothetical protein